MTLPESNPIDATFGMWKECADKFADLLHRQTAFKNELNSAATEAQVAGQEVLADILTGMAAAIGGTSPHNGKASTAVTRRRGRPPKPADDQAATT